MENSGGASGGTLRTEQGSTRACCCCWRIFACRQGEESFLQEGNSCLDLPNQAACKSGWQSCGGRPEYRTTFAVFVRRGAPLTNNNSDDAICGQNNPGSARPGASAPTGAPPLHVPQRQGGRFRRTGEPHELPGVYPQSPLAELCVTRARCRFHPREAQTARAFLQSFPEYAPTPLVALPALAAFLGLGRLFVKDESVRFGLKAFKALGSCLCGWTLAGTSTGRSFGGTQPGALVLPCGARKTRRHDFCHGH